MSRLLCVAIEVPPPLGSELNRARSELDPSRRHMTAHITLLPPFRVEDPEPTVALMRQAAASVEPFDVVLHGVGTFGIDQTTVYLALARGEDECRALYARLAADYEIVPHVTVANRCDVSVRQAALDRFADFAAHFDVTEIVLFENKPQGWVAIARVPLGAQRLPAPSVRDALDSLGLPHRVIVHTEPVTSLAEAAAVRGVDVVDVVKTLVVRRAADDYVLVLVPGGRSISWPKLRAVLGVSRLSMPPADEAREATGFERGTITPLGTVRSWPVIADSRLADRGEVTIGSGSRDVAIGVDAGALLAAVNALVADVTEPE